MENTQYTRNIGRFSYPGTNEKIQKKLTKKLKNLTNPKKSKKLKNTKKSKKFKKFKNPKKLQNIKNHKKIYKIRKILISKKNTKNKKSKKTTKNKIPIPLINILHFLLLASPANHNFSQYTNHPTNSVIQPSSSNTTLPTQILMYTHLNLQFMPCQYYTLHPPPQAEKRPNSQMAYQLQNQK